MAKQRQIQPTDIIFTDHALERIRQRGITRERVGIVLEFGEKSWSRGARRFDMTKRARRRAKRRLGRGYGRVADKLNFYLITCPYTGAVRTVAPRKRRFKRK